MSTDWRWTDEDSRDLDERNRRMRKPRPYRPPTAKGVEPVRARATTQDLPTVHIKHTKRLKRPTPEQKAQKEWERTKRDLERAGIRPVETRPDRPRRAAPRKETP